MDRLVRDLRREAQRLLMGRLGIASPEPSMHMEAYRKWIARGLHGEMGYLDRTDAVERRGDLRGTMPRVRSVVVVAQEYFQEDPPGVPEDPARGVVARYARGEDYHDVLKTRLQDLLAWIRREARERGLAPDVQGLAYVDTGPILERELAQRAGLGWFGKNTMLLHPRHGSYTFLGLLLLDLPLPPDPPFEAEHCGSCRACLDACPTGALLGRDVSGAPVMDARSCISYLTIELKGPIPRDLRPLMGNRIFGCDICQEVCPFNVKFAREGEEPAYRARAVPEVGPAHRVRAVPGESPALADLMGLSEDQFREVFSGGPIKRAKRRGFLRNVAVALGNWGSREALPALMEALEDLEPLVRGHAAWALGEVLARLGIPGDAGFVAAEALLARLEVEEDPWVREELELALRG
jgi:epoxyqueuosine reductase